jgi:phage shock protein C
MEKKLYRDEHRKMIGGVCAGLAEYFSIDVTVVRVLFLVSLILHGVGALIYIILMIVLPKKSIYNFTNPSDPATVDYIVPPPTPPTNPFQANVPFSPMPPIQPKRASSAAIVVGVLLIVIGTAFLMNEFDIIPDWNYWKLWPLMFIAIGFTYMITSRKKEPWEHDNWHKTDDTNHPSTPDNSSNNNPPTV